MNEKDRVNKSLLLSASSSTGRTRGHVLKILGGNFK